MVCGQINYLNTFIFTSISAGAGLRAGGEAPRHHGDHHHDGTLPFIYMHFLPSTHTHCDAIPHQSVGPPILSHTQTQKTHTYNTLPTTEKLALVPRQPLLPALAPLLGARLGRQCLGPRWQALDAGTYVCVCLGRREWVTSVCRYACVLVPLLWCMCVCGCFIIANAWARDGKHWTQVRTYGYIYIYVYVCVVGGWWEETNGGMHVCVIPVCKSHVTD